MSENFYLVLAGGVGAAKLIEGLANIIKPEKLKIIVNTGDDIDLFGLKICPDLDIITYTLAKVVDKEKGWGFVNESFNCLTVLKNYYNQQWFNLGDKDLATHIYRTDLFNQGYTKAQITEKICRKLGVKAHLLPMSNDPVETLIRTPSEVMHFEEYFIKYHCEPEVLDVQFRGIEDAFPVKKALEYIEKAKRIIICPSNPIVSIGTILKVKNVRDSLIKVRNKIYGVSPIIGGEAVKGPADKLMKCVGLEVSSVGVANYYRDFLGHFIIDNKDCNLKPRIEKLGINAYCYDTLMTDLRKKQALAHFLITLNE